MITLPFDPENETLRAIWDRMVKQEAKGEHLRFSTVRSWNFFDADTNSLDALELYHKICDLCYAYADRFGVQEDIEEIQQKKEQYSLKIMELLKKTKMKRKTCRECGKVLPWNYPYPMCQSCHDALYPKRYDDDFDFEDDEDFDDLF